MAERVDAAVHAEQALRLESPRQRMTSDAGRRELRPRDDAVLPRRKAGYPRVSGANGAFCPHVGALSATAGKLAPLAAVFPRERLGLAAGGGLRRPRTRSGGGGGLIQVLPDEPVEVAVEDAFRVADLDVRAMVLHPLVGVEEVGADL